MRFAQHALLSVEGLIDKMTNMYPLNPRFILPFVFVLALSLLFLLPSGLAQAQKAEQFFTYPENSTGSVATFTASDPEGASPIVWSLTANDTAADVEADDIADRALFDISQSGVLTFKNPPSYEGMSASGDDVYRVTVQASDGSRTDYFQAHIDVTDVEEAGKATWTVTPAGGTAQSLRQFQPGAVLNASVTDPDAVTGGNNGPITADITWKWYRSSTEVDGVDGTPNQYMVSDADVGMYIRVVGTYSDGRGPQESASFTSETPVQAFRRAADNSAPVFAATTVTRRIAENSTGNVGGPITATDTNGDILTYTIVDPNPQTDTDDADSFDHRRGHGAVDGC